MKKEKKMKKEMSKEMEIKLFSLTFVCFLLFPALSLASDTYDISGIWDVNYVTLHCSYHVVVTGYIISPDGTIIDIYDEQDYINDELFVEVTIRLQVTQSGSELIFIDSGDLELTGSISGDQVSLTMVVPAQNIYRPGDLIYYAPEMIYQFEGTYDPESNLITGTFTSSQEPIHQEMWIYDDGKLVEYICSDYTNLFTSGVFTVRISDKPLLLVHGFASSSRTWDIMIPFLEADGYVLDENLFTVDLSPKGFGNIKGYGQAVCNKINEIRIETGSSKVDIVAHSMGGLASRWCIQKLGSDKDVDKLIMLGTPNHGSLGFVWMQSDVWWDPPQWIPLSALQMHPYNDFLAELNYNEKRFDSNSWLIKDDQISSGYTVLAGSGFETAEMFWNTYPGNEGFIPKSTYRGDGVVGVRSANLTNVPCHQYNATHTSLNVASNVILDVIHLLNNEPIVHGIACQPSPRDSNEPSIWQRIHIKKNDLILKGTIKMFDIILDTMPLVEIGIGYPGSELDLTLITPSGVVIDPTYASSDPNIDFTYDVNSTDNCGNTYDEKYYTISNPEVGTWAIKVTAVDTPPEGEHFSVGAMLESNLTLLVRTRDNIYSFAPGQDVILEAFLWDGSLVNYSETEIRAIIEKPNETTETIAFRDDGTNGDSVAGDGVFTYNYTDTAPNGMYYAEINANSDWFIRQTQFIFSVDMLLDGVDFTDYAVFASYWVDHNCVEPDWCEGADLNKSGEVDIFDLKVFTENWLEGAEPY